MSETNMKDEVIIYKKSLITNALNKCTEEQQKFFIRIYGEISLIDESKLDQAMTIIERTINKRKQNENNTTRRTAVVD